MKPSKNKKFYFKRGLLWLLIASIYSFFDELIQENFIDNHFITNLSTVFWFIVWFIFIYYCVNFWRYSVKFKPFH